ncbi:hypothetical protein [Paludibacterium paludis]|uniref:Uncharacterized protein n=1 Tax=Paludibacterium paludis TaxID=1225769 RepID=A0A918P5G5_9NEIS|nr:hypothetical protein [Paludibacterium paludis]GGY21185.1 hypothetical protein GCM10011289_26100 [Paludibacterium paludis]
MFVESKKIPNKVEVLGFEQVDKNAHMIEWLRKGENCREFITLDLEGELYAQDQGAQLLSVHLNSQPSFETRVRKDESGKQAIVTHFSVIFPISLRVKASNGVVWLLDVIKPAIIIRTNGILPPKFDSLSLKIAVFDSFALINMRIPEVFLPNLLWWHVGNEM